MGQTLNRTWAIYVLLFVALWALNVVIDLAPGVPRDVVKHAALLGVVRGGPLALFLGALHLFGKKRRS